MTDLNPCPFCGAEEEHSLGADTVYCCGSVMHGYGSEGGPRSKDCIIAALRAELAKANALLDRVRKWLTDVHIAPADPIKAIDFVLDQMDLLALDLGVNPEGGTKRKDGE